MGLFGRSSKQRYGALIDIGSGSVLASIVASNPTTDKPHIIWFKREYTPLRQKDSLKDSAKSVLTSLLNVLMLLNKDGKQALYRASGRQRLDTIQITISAPWSYTVTKTISYNKEDSFAVTEELIEELQRTAHTKVAEELKENERIHDLGLTIMSRNLTAIIANGYRLSTVAGQTATTLKLVESNAISQTYLQDNVSEVLEKILPGHRPKFYSFILVFYEIFKVLAAEIEECSLVDITYEATEIGIVRDGVLTYCTHIPFGAATLAREIAVILEVPLEEAFVFLSEPNLDLWLSSFSETKRADVERVFSIYEDKLSEAFKETGDALAVPKKIYLHGNLGSEQLFKTLIARAAERATLSTHTLYPVNDSPLLKRLADSDRPGDKTTPTPDPTLLITAQFFHMKELHARFEQP